MTRDPFGRIALTLIAVTVAVTVMVAALFKVARSGAFAACTGTAAFGWTVPVVGGVVIAAVAWLLLHTGDAESDDERARMTSRCSACGEPVIDNWRLCPYCGMMMGATPHTAPPEDAV